MFYYPSYSYLNRTNFPYPPSNVNIVPIGYGGSFGTGSYSLGGGYYGGQSYLTRPLTGADIYLQANGWSARGSPRLRPEFQRFQGYPYYDSDGVFGQMRPEWWIAQRQAFQALQPVQIPLIDNRPADW